MELKVENMIITSKCKCCLEEKGLKNMWNEHYWMGEREIYGEMLTECFAFEWLQPADIDEAICEPCITRLRDAFNFRKQVLASQQTIHDMTLETVTDEDTPHMPQLVKVEKFETEELPSESEATEYEEIEYLEDEFPSQAKVDEEPHGSQQTSHQNKHPKNKRLSTYKLYTEEAMRDCIEAIRANKMTITEAAKHYNIPRKTVCSKLKDAEYPDDAPKSSAHQSFLEEIKTILIYTNAIPFKTKTARYYCAYCSTNGAHYEDADELRKHTRINHASERTKNIDVIMNPIWLNEVIKLDIENLNCMVCYTMLMTWNDMFKHLQQAHDVQLDEAYTRVIPFVLKSDLHCALCNEKFPNYHHLDAHMNAHYANYICNECGDTFLSSNRLKKHVQTHDTGKFPCGECGKVFSLDKYREKHIKLVHSREETIKCLYCPEKFLGEHHRHLHVKKAHPDKVKSITCEFCGKTFDWQPYYLKHMRRAHTDNKDHVCEVCGKAFFSKHELKNHETRHSNVKNFSCDHCGKTFRTKPALKMHFRSHHTNKM